MTALTTEAQIETFRLITLRAALKLEIVGLKRRGQSAYKILKGMGFAGSRQSVVEQVSDEIEYRKANF
jgi:hypothetical protein